MDTYLMLLLSDGMQVLLSVFCLQMVWENGCVVIVMLTPLVESGVKQCYHYWPDEGSNLYHIYEVKCLSMSRTDCVGSEL